MTETTSLVYAVFIPLVFFLKTIECCNIEPEDHEYYICGNGKGDNRCTREDYNGVFINAYALINKCADEYLPKKGMKLQNLIHCLHYGQDPSGTKCHKEDPECRACQYLIFCVLRGLGVINTDKEVDNQKMCELVNIMKTKISDFYDFDVYWDKCKHYAVTGPDHYQRTYDTMMCLINIDHKKSMDIMSSLVIDLVLAEQHCGKKIKCTSYKMFYVNE